MGKFAEISLGGVYVITPSNPNVIGRPFEAKTSPIAPFNRVPLKPNVKGKPMTDSYAKYKLAAVRVTSPSSTMLLTLMVNVFVPAVPTSPSILHVPEVLIHSSLAHPAAPVLPAVPTNAVPASAEVPAVAVFHPILEITHRVPPVPADSAEGWSPARMDKEAVPAVPEVPAINVMAFRSMALFNASFIAKAMIYPPYSAG
jgi:hypothetical protein